MKSRATCDRASTALPRSPTDVPVPSGQWRCRMHREHLLRAASESLSGRRPRSDRTIAKATCAHVPSAAAFPTQACCCLRDARIPYAWRKEDAACMLAGSSKSAGRGCSERESRVSSAGRAVYHPNAQGGMAMLAHAAGSYRCASRARLRLHGAVSFAS